MPPVWRTRRRARHGRDRARYDHRAHRLRGAGLHPVQGGGWPAHAVLQQLPPAVLLRTTDVTGVVDLPEGTDMVMPGDNIASTTKAPDRHGPGPSSSPGSI